MKRQELIDDLVSLLKTISHKNGFYSEVGANVFEWYEKPLEDEDYPAIIVRDPNDNAQDENNSINHALKIEIDIAISSGKETTIDMRKVSSDVLKAFGMFEEKNNYVCLYKGSDSLTKQESKFYGGMRLEFEIKYQTRRWEQ